MWLIETCSRSSEWLLAINIFAGHWLVNAPSSFKVLNKDSGMISILLAMEWLQSATKLVDYFTLAKGAFWRFTDFKKENKAFLPSSPLCNVVPLFKVSVENNKHPKFEWRGRGRGLDCFVPWSDPTWVQYLNNFVADFSQVNMCVQVFISG